MAKQTFAEFTNSVKTMVSALQSNKEAVAKRGLDIEFINNLSSNLSLINQLDNEQETLKAKLKTKSSELTHNVEETKKLLSEAKKTVKLAIPQEGWREFGIKASR